MHGACVCRNIPCLSTTLHWWIACVSTLLLAGSCAEHQSWQGWHVSGADTKHVGGGMNDSMCTLYTDSYKHCYAAIWPVLARGGQHTCVLVQDQLMQTTLAGCNKAHNRTCHNVHDNPCHAPSRNIMYALQQATGTALDEVHADSQQVVACTVQAHPPGGMVPHYPALQSLHSKLVMTIQFNSTHTLHVQFHTIAVSRQATIKKPRSLLLSRCNSFRS